MNLQSAVCALQARVRVAHHKAQAKMQAEVEKEMEASLKLLRGLQEQLGSCQSPPSLGLICRRAQFLKACPCTLCPVKMR